MTVKFADGSEIHFQYDVIAINGIKRRVAFAWLTFNNSDGRIDGPLAICSEHDQSRAYGRRKALTNLIRRIVLTREQRREVWRAYFYQHADLKPDSKHEVGRDMLDALKKKASDWDRLASRAVQAMAENTLGPGYTAEQMDLLRRKAAAFDYLCEEIKDFLYYNFGELEPTCLDAVERRSIKK